MIERKQHIKEMEYELWIMKLRLNTGFLSNDEYLKLISERIKLKHKIRDIKLQFIREQKLKRILK